MLHSETQHRGRQVFPPAISCVAYPARTLGTLLTAKTSKKTNPHAHTPARFCSRFFLPFSGSTRFAAGMCIIGKKKQSERKTYIAFISALNNIFVCCVLLHSSCKDTLSAPACFFRLTIRWFKPTWSVYCREFYPETLLSTNESVGRVVRSSKRYIFHLYLGENSGVVVVVGGGVSWYTQNKRQRKRWILTPNT